MADISMKLDPRIVIGQDTVNRLGLFCSELGGRALLVSEQVLYENKVIDRVVAVLADAGVETIVFDEVPAQATAEVAENAAELARGARCSVVIALGGLKTLAVGRTVSLLASGKEYLFDLLDGAIPSGPALPFIAVPTTGRDPFLFSDRYLAVDPRDRSIRVIKTNPGLCVAAVLDPGLSESLSGKFAATTAFDGFLSTFEAYCSTKANFFSDALLERAMELYVRIMDSFADGRPFDALGVSTQAGFLSSLGIASSTPGVGTALSFALNGRFPVAKSWCATVLLPYVMEFYAKARVEKLSRIAALIGEAVEGASSTASAGMAVDAIRRRMGLLKVPARLKDFGLVLDRLVPIAEMAKDLEFVAFCPRAVSSEDAYDLLKQAF